MFDEYSERAHYIAKRFEAALIDVELRFTVSYKTPPHDIARRLLNEIKEFEPIKA